MRKTLILFTSLAFALPAARAYAVGVGAYGTLSGGKTTQGIRDNSLTLLYTYVRLPKGYRTVSAGGGLVLDTNLASRDVFNYRLKFGVEQHTAKREAAMKLTRLRLDQVFGFGLVQTDMVRWFFGPMIEGRYSRGDDTGFVSSFASYGAAAGLATGVNLNLGKNLTLAVEGGFKYGMEWTGQQWNSFFNLVPSLAYYLRGKRAFSMHGYEGYGNLAVLYRVGSDSPSKIRYVEAKQ